MFVRLHIGFMVFMVWLLMADVSRGQSYAWDVLPVVTRGVTPVPATSSPEICQALFDGRCTVDPKIRAAIHAAAGTSVTQAARGYGTGSGKEQEGSTGGGVGVDRRGGILAAGAGRDGLPDGTIPSAGVGNGSVAADAIISEGADLVLAALDSLPPIGAPGFRPGTSSNPDAATADNRILGLQPLSVESAAPSEAASSTGLKSASSDKGQDLAQTPSLPPGFKPSPDGLATPSKAVADDRQPDTSNFPATRDRQPGATPSARSSAVPAPSAGGTPPLPPPQPGGGVVAGRSGGGGPEVINPTAPPDPPVTAIQTIEGRTGVTEIDELVQRLKDAGVIDRLQPAVAPNTPGVVLLAPDKPVASRPAPAPQHTQPGRAPAR